MSPIDKRPHSDWRQTSEDGNGVIGNGAIGGGDGCIVESKGVWYGHEIYGDYNFFDPKYFHLIIDTYSSGPLETVGKVLDKLGYKH